MTHEEFLKLDFKVDNFKITKNFFGKETLYLDKNTKVTIGPLSLFGNYTCRLKRRGFDSFWLQTAWAYTVNYTSKDLINYLFWRENLDKSRRYNSKFK